MLRVLNHDVAPSRVFTPALALAATSRALLRARGRRRKLLAEMATIARNQVRRRWRGGQSVPQGLSMTNRQVPSD